MPLVGCMEWYTVYLRLGHSLPVGLNAVVEFKDEGTPGTSPRVPSLCLDLGAHRRATLSREEVEHDEMSCYVNEKRLEPAQERVRLDFLAALSAPSARRGK